MDGLTPKSISELSLYKKYNRKKGNRSTTSSNSNKTPPPMVIKSPKSFFANALSPKKVPSPRDEDYSASGEQDDSSKKSTGNLSRCSAQSTSSGISVIIGKTFEATTLPDGSHQIIEATKYKRLSDGYIYTESKMRSLDDVDDNKENEATPSSQRNATPKRIGEGREDVGSDKRHTNKGDIRDGGNDLQMVGMQHSPSVSPMKSNRRTPKSHQYTPKSHDQDHQYPDGDILSTFSSSSYSSQDDENNTNFMSVITEDHGFNQTEIPKQDFVEEYLYDNDPVGLQQYQEQQPLSPSEANGNNKGWNPWSGIEDDSDENSLQLVKPKQNSLWLTPTKRAADAVRGFFQGDDHPQGHCGALDESGFPVDLTRGKRGSDEEAEDEETGVGSRKQKLPCNERMRTRRCKLLVLAILVVAVVTIVAAVRTVGSQKESAMKYIADEEDQSGGASDVAVVPPPGEDSAPEKIEDNKPAAPTCIPLKIVMSTSSMEQKEDTNAWSLTRKNKENGKDITIKSSDELPESEGTIHTFKRCVQPGVYTFTISDSSGDGLGNDGKSGYYITANDVTLGVSSFFYHEERMTFTLPFDAVEHHHNKDTVCTDDFVLAIKTDGNPQETRWNVIDNDTQTQVLAGGPYTEPWAVYTRRACLPDGSYTFNMLDEGGDGVCCEEGKGFFVLTKDGETIVNSDGKFGEERSKEFLLGEPLVRHQ